MDGAGDCVIADKGNHRIQRCPAAAPGALCETVAGTGSEGSSSVEFNNPHDVALNTDGDYLVADRDNHRVQRCPAASPGGDCETVAGGSQGSGLTELNGPCGIAIDVDGSLLVADTYNHRLLRCPTGAFCQAIFGGFGSGPTEFNFPYSVAVLSPSTTTAAATTGYRTDETTDDVTTTAPATVAVVSGGSTVSLAAMRALSTALMFRF